MFENYIEKAAKDIERDEMKAKQVFVDLGLDEYKEKALDLLHFIAGIPIFFAGLGLSICGVEPLLAKALMFSSFGIMAYGLFVRGVLRWLAQRKLLRGGKPKGYNKAICGMLDDTDEVV